MNKSILNYLLRHGLLTFGIIGVLSACSGSGGGTGSAQTSESAITMNVTGVVTSSDTSSIVVNQTQTLSMSNATTSCLADTVTATNLESGQQAASTAVASDCSFSISVPVNELYSFSFSLGGAEIATLGFSYGTDSFLDFAYVGTDLKTYDLGALSLRTVDTGVIAFQSAQAMGERYDRDGDSIQDASDSDIDGDGIPNSEETGICIFDPSPTCTGTIPWHGGGSGGGDGGNPDDGGGSTPSDPGDGESDCPDPDGGCTDEPPSQTCTSDGRDMDGDTYFHEGVEPNYMPQYDCNDSNGGIRPGGNEVPCNTVDEDCDGIAEFPSGTIVDERGCTISCEDFNRFCPYDYDKSEPIYNGSEFVGCQGASTYHPVNSGGEMYRCPDVNGPTYTTCDTAEWMFETYSKDNGKPNS